MNGQENLPEGLEAALRRLTDQLKELDPAEHARFQELLGEHGHDIKNSLSRIIGANGLLFRLGKGMDGKDGETLREMTEIIKRAVSELDVQIDLIIQGLQ